MKYIIGTLMIILLMAVAGCTAPTCYPPNKIIGNNCCQDSDDNDVCDYDEQTEEEEEPVATVDETPEEVEMEEEEEPQIQQVEMPEPEPVEAVDPLEPGKYEIKFGEPKQYIEINEIKTYRTSRDKGIVDEITFTVRNLGAKTLNPVVDLHYDGAGVNYMDTERVPEYEIRVDKEYTLQKIEPGEKLVVKKSVGIRYQSIETRKEITLDVYERFVSPKKDLGTDSQTFVPVDLFETMEIYTYGPPETY